MMENLGGFGDLRLQKGGPFCWHSWSRAVSAAYGYVRWASIGLGRSVSDGFFTTVA